MDKVDGFRQRVEQMIAGDRLQDAIESLLSINDLEKSTRSELIAHMAELRRVDRAMRLGVNAAQGAEDRRRLRYSVLELLDEMLRTVSPNKLPFVQPTVDLEVPDQTPLEKIIGANNLKKIAWLELGLKRSMAVGRIVTSNGMGTGFLIKGPSLVTNAHVLPTAEIAARSTVDFNYQEDIDGKMLNPARYALDATKFRTDHARDISVVGISRTHAVPDLHFWGLLDVHLRKEPSIGDHVSIIQHPNGGAKQIACTANQVVNIYEHRLQYLTDTLPGSSGAPVFDDDWMVVAVHHAGGNLKSNERGETRYVNEGIMTSKIDESLLFATPA